MSNISKINIMDDPSGGISVIQEEILDDDGYVLWDFSLWYFEDEGWSAESWFFDKVVQTKNYPTRAEARAAIFAYAKYDKDGEINETYPLSDFTVTFPCEGDEWSDDDENDNCDNSHSYGYDDDDEILF